MSHYAVIDSPADDSFKVIMNYTPLYNIIGPNHGFSPDVREVICQLSDKIQSYCPYLSWRPSSTIFEPCAHCKSDRMCVRVECDHHYQIPVRDNLLCLARLHERPRDCDGHYDKCRDVFLCYPCLVDMREPLVRALFELERNDLELSNHYVERQPTVMVASGCVESGDVDAAMSYLDTCSFLFADLWPQNAYCNACSAWKSRRCVTQCPTVLQMVHSCPLSCKEDAYVCWREKRHIDYNRALEMCVEDGCKCSHSPYMCVVEKCHPGAVPYFPVVEARKQAAMASEGAVESSNEFTSVSPCEEEGVVVPFIPAKARCAVACDPLVTDAMLTKMYPIKNGINWNTTQTRNISIATLNFPDSFYEANVPARAIRAYHRYFRGGFRLCFKWNSPPTLCGLAVAFAAPTPVWPENFDSIFSYPHVFIRPGIETCASLEVPWFNRDRTVIASLTNVVTACVKIFVVSPLKTGAGSSSTMSIACWAELIDPEYMVKYPNVRVQSKSNAHVHENVLTNLLSSVPIAGDIAKVLGGVVGLFDSPGVPDEASPARSVLADVPRPVFHTGYKRSVADSDDDNFGVPRMRTIKERVRQWGYHDTLVATTSQVAGAVLGSFVTGSPMVSTPLGCCKQYFQVRRGSEEFKFIFVGSIFHQIGVNFSLWPDSTPPTVFDDRLLGCNTVSYQFSGEKNSIIIRVPWMGVTDYTAVNELGASVVVWINNPLTSNDTVSSSMDIVTYCRAGPDFELAEPCEPTLNGYKMPADMYFPIAERLQSSTAMEDEEVISFFPNDLVEPGYLKQGDWDVRELMRRPCWCGNTTGQTSGEQDQFNVVRATTQFPAHYGSDKDAISPMSSLAFLWNYTSGGVRVHLDTSCTKADNFHLSAVRTAISTTSAACWFPLGTSLPFLPIRINSLIRGGLFPLNQVSDVVLECPGPVTVPYTIQRSYVDRTQRIPILDVSMVELSRNAVTSNLVRCLWGVSAADDWDVHVPASTPTLVTVTVDDVDGAEDEFPVLEARVQCLSKPVKANSETVVEGLVHSVRVLEARTQGLPGWDGLMSLIRSIRNSILSFPEAIRSVLAASKTVNRTLEVAQKSFERLVKFFTTVFDEVLPLVTAIHTLLNGDSLMKGVAIASIMRLIYRNVSHPDKIEQGDVEGEGASGASRLVDFHVDSDEYTSSRSDSEESASGGDFATIHGRKQAGFADILGNPLTWVFNVAVFVWIDKAARSFGYVLGPGYRKYLRRVVGEGAEPSLSSVLQLVWHSICYIFCGDSLNDDWERGVMLRLTQSFAAYDRCAALNMFEPEKIDTIIPGSNITGRVLLDEVVEEIRSFQVKMHEFRIVPFGISTKVDKIISVAARIERSERDAVDHAEPVCIFMYGDPGVGKSLLLTRILPAHVLNACRLGTGDVAKDVYNGLFTDQCKFLDGYEGNPWFNIDEFLQSTASSDAEWFIRVVNTTAMPINKADISEKGRRFRSPFVGVTSNVSSMMMADNAIRCPAAIARRFFISVKACLREGSGETDEDADAFATIDGKLDVERFTRALLDCNDAGEQARLCDRVWVFKCVNPLTGSMESVNGKIKTLKFSDIKREMTIEHARRLTIYENLKKMSEKLRLQSGRGAPKDEIGAERTKFDFKGFVDETREVRDEDNGLQGLVTNFAAMEEYTSEQANLFVSMARLMSDGQLLADAEVLGVKLDTGVENPFQEARRAYCGNYEIKTTKRMLDGDYFQRADYVYRLTDEYVRRDRERTEKSKRRWRWLGILGEVMTFGVFFSLGVAIAKFVKKLLGQGTEILQAYSGTAIKSKEKKIPVVNGAIPQAGGDSDVYARIRRALREIRWDASRNGEKDSSVVQAMCLDQKHLLIPNHFYSDIKKKRDAGWAVAVTISTPGEDGMPTEVLPVCISDYNSTALADGKFPVDARLVVLRTERMPRARSIWHFITERTWKEAPINTRGVVLNHECRRTPTGDYDVTIKSIAIPSYMASVSGISYAASTVRSTEDGDCGLPYCLPSKLDAGRVIVGIHTYINDANGIVGAAPLNRAMLEAAKIEIGISVDVVEKEEFPIVVTKVQSTFWNTNMELVGTGRFGDWDVKQFAPPQTKLTRCTYRGTKVLNDDDDCDYELPPMRTMLVDGVLKHPMLSNAQKYASKALFTPAVVMHDHAVNHYVAKFPVNRVTRLFTLDEAINGVLPMQPVQINTSAGYWTSFGFKEGKRHFFDDLPQEVDAFGETEPVKRVLSAKAKQHVVPLFNTTFEQRFRDCVEMIEKGVSPMIMWISTLKDELRSPAKCRECKVRVFEQPPLEFTLLCRMYFGDFFNFFKTRAGFTYYHGIGADKEEVWMAYWRELISTSHVGMDFDYGNYDGTVCQAAFQFFEDVVRHYYRDAPHKEQIARVALLDMLRETYLIMGDKISYAIKGNKSGNPFTDIFNSITNTYVMYIAWMCCHSSTCNLHEFDEGVRMLTYGDDVVMSIRPDLTTQFNGERIQNVMKYLGYDITSAAKTTVIEKFRPLKEVTFLKSPFVVRDGVCWAPLPERDILKELKYRNKMWEGDEEDLRLRLLVTQKFMAHHGEVKLKNFQQTMVDRGLPRRWMTVTYESERQRIWTLQKNAVLT